MKIRLAVPVNTITHKFHSSYNKDEFPDVELFKVPENKVRDLLYANRVEAALIDPLTYGLGVKKGDFRIIPETALSSLSYTELVSVYFNKGLDTLRTIAVPDKSDYIVLISLILLGERYGIIPDIVEKKDYVGELLKEFDSAMIYGHDKHFNGLDISEDWFDLYQKPMPLAFWVCRANEHPENIGEIVRRIASKEIETDIEIGDKSNPEARFGRYIHKFTTEFESATEQVLDLLFFHKLIDVIPEVKVLEE